jgi:NADH:ubiquinone oxidoreductase subunit 6 (subunit J)
VVAALLGFCGIAWSARAVGHAPGSVSGPVGSADVFGSVTDFGRALFGPYLLPFEVTALVLAVAVIGVVMLAADGASAP